jgi:hypothetical protein
MDKRTLAAATLIAVFFAVALTESLGKSPTSDEPPHLASGLSYVSTGVFRGNPQHPPLLKELSGLSLLIGGVRWPKTADANRMLYGAVQPGEQPDWDIGRALVSDNGPDRVMFWARLPLLLVACLLGALIYVWGSRLLGRAAALGATVLFAASPTVMAHSYLVTTDVGVSAFSMLFLFAVWEYLQRPTGKGMVWCGLALGAVLCAKFSAALLLPVAFVLFAAAVRKRAPQAGPNDACPCGSGKKYKACHGAPGSKPAAAAGPDLRACAEGFAVMCLVAAATVWALYGFGNPFQWVDGLRLVNADHKTWYPMYLAGQLAPHFYSYFAVAWLLKEPIAGIALALAGLALLLRDRSIDRQRKLFLLLPPAVMFAGATLWADNLGVRYIMPVLPFAFLLGGLALVKLFTMTAKWARPLGVALCCWLAVAQAGVYPDHLPYFNEAACLLTEPGKVGLDGGSRCGVKWLDDSNVDWGQSLKQLKAWADANAKGRPIRHANTFGVASSVYGVPSPEVSALELQDQAVPGLYAVSAHLVARVPVQENGKSWLQRIPPIAIVGHSLWIYDYPRTPR